MIDSHALGLYGCAMGRLTQDAIVHLLAGEVMTARCEATRPAHRAWVGVVSLEERRVAYLNTADASALGRIHVQRFEIADAVLGRGDDVEPEEASCSERHVVTGAQETEALLERFGVDPSSLAFKSVTEYPL